MPQGYFSFYKNGDWREIPDDRSEDVLKITLPVPSYPKGQCTTLIGIDMLSIKMSYMIEVNPQEFRLISAALQGKLKEEWKQDALNLQDRLFQARNREVQNKLSNIAKE